MGKKYLRNFSLGIGNHQKVITRTAQRYLLMSAGTWTFTLSGVNMRTTCLSGGGFSGDTNGAGAADGTYVLAIRGCNQWDLTTTMSAGSSTRWSSGNGSCTGTPTTSAAITLIIDFPTGGGDLFTCDATGAHGDIFRYTGIQCDLGTSMTLANQADPATASASGGTATLTWNPCG